MTKQNLLNLTQAGLSGTLSYRSSKLGLKTSFKRRHPLL